MKITIFTIALTTGAALAQTPAAPYQPGVTYQSANPNYPVRNPFYFEGRIDWNLLKIDQPANAWEFAQRGIHKQDDLEDIPGAIADYRQGIATNNLDNGTCQLVAAVPANFGQNVNPPPCMFTLRLRLGRLLMGDNPDQALKLFGEVLAIDPLRLGVHALMAETYAATAEQEPDESVSHGLLEQAAGEYQAELALSPVTDFTKKLSGDQANNAHIHWALAGLYDTLGRPADQMRELDLYIKATKWHSDTYPWRIQLAQSKLQQAQQERRSPVKKRN